MSFVSDIIGSVTGSGQADAARDSANIQAQAGQAGIEAQLQGNREAIAASNAAADKGIGFLDQFSGITQRGINDSSFLANPQAQFDFLQNNPLFDLALENANRETNARAASQGRLNSGDTLKQLSNNVLLTSQPLIDRQRSDISNLLNIGLNTTTAKANTAIGAGSTASNILANQGANVSNSLANIGAAQAGGVVGAQNAKDQGVGNLISLGGAIFSDPELKENKIKIGCENGYTKWSWSWKKKATEMFGLSGDSYGVMADEVEKKNPAAVTWMNGYRKVNYDMIGVSHGS